jgi:hypothetical protein
VGDLAGEKYLEVLIQNLKVFMEYDKVYISILFIYLFLP